MLFYSFYNGRNSFSPSYGPIDIIPLWSVLSVQVLLPASCNTINNLFNRIVDSISKGYALQKSLNPIASSCSNGCPEDRAARIRYGSLQLHP